MTKQKNTNRQTNGSLNTIQRTKDWTTGTRAGSLQKPGELGCSDRFGYFRRHDYATCTNYRTIKDQFNLQQDREQGIQFYHTDIRTINNTEKLKKKLVSAACGTSGLKKIFSSVVSKPGLYKSVTDLNLLFSLVNL